MILVVAGTSPLNYLVQIGRQELLPALYERIMVPRAVLEELTHPETPAIVRNWLDSGPKWLEARNLRGL